MKAKVATAFVSLCVGMLLRIEATLWTQWGEWTTCNVTCGGGFKIRTRNCQKNIGERYCDGPKIQKRVCNKVQCRKPLLSAVSYWGEWSEWGLCSLKGSIIELRTRTCYVTLEDRVMPCLGDSFEMRDNSWPECSLTGSWGKWSDWSNPSVTCSNSQYHNVTRSRLCLGKHVKGLVLVCSGVSKENKGIKLPKCYKWTEWTEWISYESSNENFCIRERECLPAPGHCPGPYKEGSFCQKPANKNEEPNDYNQEPSSEFHNDGDNDDQTMIDECLTDCTS